MPIYEYECKRSDCKHRFERVEPASADIKRICPECDEKSAERLPPLPARAQFKGTGFYETDYK